MHYFLSMVVYSDSIIDLFQRVHFHAGAISFSEYSILNPFYANSYIPFQQVLLGLLSFFKIDLLLMEWVLPLIFTPIKIVAIYLFIEKFIDDKRNQLICVGLIIAILGISNPTNGDISQIAIFIFLSFLFSKNLEIVSKDVLKNSFFTNSIFSMCIYIKRVNLFFSIFNYFVSICIPILQVLD